VARMTDTQTDNLSLQIVRELGEISATLKSVEKRLESGDEKFERLSARLDSRPCLSKNRCTDTSSNSRNSDWKKSPIIWSSGVASFLIGIIEIFKHYFSTK